MSADYKTIRRTREAVKELKSAGWNDTKIAKTIGVAVSIIRDIVIIDEVAMNLREPTIEKFRKFLDTSNLGKAYMADEVQKNNPPPEPIIEYKDPGPPPYKGKNIAMPEDLLADLNTLSTKFASKGYRLDCVITLQHLPE